VTARVACTLLAAAAVAALATSPVRGEEDLGRALAAAVDLPTREARLAAAVKLAARTDVSLDEWLAATRSFGSFQRVLPGPITENVKLLVGATHEPTSIACFVPAGYVPGKPAPLLLALHGAGGEGHDENDLWQAAAESLGTIIVAPTDPGADLGYRYTAAERQRALAALRWARRRFDVDENRVCVTGVSRGGHLAWDLALRHPDQFAGLVPMIGGPRLQTADGQNNLRYLENVAHLAIADLQGAADDPLLVKNLKTAFARLQSFGAKKARLVLHPDVGHDFDPHAIDWKEFLGGAVRESPPMRVVRASARLDEARSAWAEITRFWPTVDEKFRADIEQRKWEAMDDDERRAWIQSEADKRTARLEVRLDGPGRFTATTSLVQRFRLLLSREMLGAGAVEVTTNGKPARYAAQQSKLVLLRDFVERFDRTFLPVVEVSCP
jgi:dienelactone hydrolase